MILSFKQKFPDGTPTYFIHKIWRSLADNAVTKLEALAVTSVKASKSIDFIAKFGHPWDGHWSDTNTSFETVLNLLPKLHTIRAGARWKAGDKIHFCINARTPNYFQFAPVVKVVSVQSIEIKWIANLETGKGVTVCIDGEYHVDITQLAQNDGFPSVEAFFNWFSEDFTGQIIHWTPLKY